MAPAHEEIFILDLVCPDGSNFVTAAWPAEQIEVVARRHQATHGTVSHWKRGAASTPEPISWRHPRDGWELKSRTPL